LNRQSQILADEIGQYLKRLFPVTRSITGSGNRETLRILHEIVPLEIKEYSSGTVVYDWIIPDEWHVRDAWIKDSTGNKLVDFKINNVHLVSYSEPVNKSISFDALTKGHLHYHKEIPEAIPYRTSYYRRDWGFCVTQAQYEALQAAEGLLEVYIDSEFYSQGSLTIAELLIPGELEEEILISTYNCHPSLANDNLSGTVMTAFLARELLEQKNLKRSYRIIWVPETIGAIAYCAKNEAAMKKIQSGLVVTTVGGPGPFGYKQSFDSLHSINVIIETVFKDEGIDGVTYPFDIHGSDERQYSSLGFRINTASITKDRYYEYPYYHTSLDNLDFVKPQQIVESLLLHLKVLDKLNHELVFQSNYPNCEVMLSKHDLYPKTGGAQLPSAKAYTELDLILWLLWLADGKNGLYGIARKLEVSVETLNTIARKLVEKQVLQQIN
jgi:aminopeptidase-like protein